MSDNLHAEPVVDLIAANLSTAREKLLEHRLVSELAVLMMQRGTALDVLRSDFDAQGHDVVLEAAGIIRHVQLKAMVEGGKRRDVDINVRLRSKPSGCVAWMTYDPGTLAITGYRWFGGGPGEPLPDLGSRVTRHTKGDSTGARHQRPALRNIGIGQFEKLTGLSELADRLFGPVQPEATSLVLAQLRRQFGTSWREAIARTTREPGFEGSIELAHLIDGYQVLEQLCELDPDGWLTRNSVDLATGSLDVGTLWTLLFLEHRRWRFASPAVPAGEEQIRLDALANRLAHLIQLDLMAA